MTPADSRCTFALIRNWNFDCAYFTGAYVDDVAFDDDLARTMFAFVQGKFTRNTCASCSGHSLSMVEVAAFSMAGVFECVHHNFDKIRNRSAGSLSLNHFGIALFAPLPSTRHRSRNGTSCAQILSTTNYKFQTALWNWAEH
jgi:hypothetical protein